MTYPFSGVTWFACWYVGSAALSATMASFTTHLLLTGTSTWYVTFMLGHSTKTVKHIFGASEVALGPRTILYQSFEKVYFLQRASVPNLPIQGGRCSSLHWVIFVLFALFLFHWRIFRLYPFILFTSLFFLVKTIDVYIKGIITNE